MDRPIPATIPNANGVAWWGRDQIIHAVAASAALSSDACGEAGVCGSIITDSGLYAGRTVRCCRS